MNRQNDITTAAAEWHNTSTEMQRFTGMPKLIILNLYMK